MEQRWREAVTSQGAPGAPGAERGRDNPPWEPLEGAAPGDGHRGHTISVVSDECLIHGSAPQGSGSLAKASRREWGVAGGCNTGKCLLSPATLLEWGAVGREPLKGENPLSCLPGGASSDLFAPLILSGLRSRRDSPSHHTAPWEPRAPRLSISLPVSGSQCHPSARPGGLRQAGGRGFSHTSRGWAPTDRPATDKGGCARFTWPRVTEPAAASQGPRNAAWPGVAR